jgi:hypothetical protein
MLGAKASCKDRWRQVLAEADRIPMKHICTLEPAITENQTDEMQRNGVTLVVPRSIQMTYSTSQRARLLSLGGFINELTSIQGAGDE